MEHQSEKFSVQEPITSDVWVATRADGSQVVVKRFFNLVDNKSQTRRLGNEIKAGELLKDRKGIAQCLNYFEDLTLDCSFLVVKRIEGQDLFGTLEQRRFKPFEEGEVKDIARQLLDILEGVHSLGIAHLDIKLENVMLTPSTKKVTLIDFGLCEIASPSERVSSWVGSQDYASPEILTHKPFDPFISDIYSFGILLFTLLFGQLPFSFQNKSNNLILFKEQPQISWPSSSEVSAQAKNLISRMLENCPEDRITLANMRGHPLFLEMQSCTDAMELQSESS